MSLQELLDYLRGVADAAVREGIRPCDIQMAVEMPDLAADEDGWTDPISLDQHSLSFTLPNGESLWRRLLRSITDD